MTNPNDEFRMPNAVAWRWVHVGLAALAMVLTLPGRTHGLGLFTEPLLKSLGLDRQSYGFLNLWATLLGSLFCLPCGWLLDRLGTRTVYIGVTLALGATVVAMSQLTTGASASTLELGLPEWTGGPVTIVVMTDLFVFLLLTRGFGQSALSVVSLALIGRSAGKRSGLAMGVYAFCTTAGFLGAFILLGSIVKKFPNEWRLPWLGIGVSVMVLGLLGGMMVRNRVLETGKTQTDPEAADESSLSLGRALLSPAFWTFTLATSFYGLVVAGTSLFGESILKERGFNKDVFVTVTQIGVPVGLAANLLVGWLATLWPLQRLMAVATAMLAATLFAFPHVTSKSEVYIYAVSLSAVGGAITVCFFTVYRTAFGPGRLGSIQGLAQMITVLFSAVGPQVFATTQARLGSYSPLFPVFAGIAMVLAVACWLFRLPDRGIGSARKGSLV
jgi:MFS family permease